MKLKIEGKAKILWVNIFVYNDTKKYNFIPILIIFVK